ncbi:hypothetical protein M0R45_008849 [Rubus argutus]|uniref:Uncharacterized protein n=1 Tax=Rubus argutus TaxID=59490 RepID=A0AAW1Y2X0_RUBAR
MRRRRQGIGIDGRTATGFFFFSRACGDAERVVRADLQVVGVGEAELGCLRAWAHGDIDGQQRRQGARLGSSLFSFSFFCAGDGDGKRARLCFGFLIWGQKQQLERQRRICDAMGDGLWPEELAVENFVFAG